MTIITETGLKILKKKAFANLATVDEQGQPQVTPVWVDYDGEYILVNSAKGRKKDRNMRQSGKVALSIMDPDDPYHYLGVQGNVVEITETGAAEHINKLSQKYTGKDFNISPQETRVLYKIRPDRVW